MLAERSLNGKRYLHPRVSIKGACLVLSAHALRFSLDVKLLQRIFGYTKRFKKPLSSGHVGPQATESGRCVATTKMSHVEAWTSCKK